MEPLSKLPQAVRDALQTKPLSGDHSLSWDQIEGMFNWPEFYDEVLATTSDGDTLVELGSLRGQSMAYLATKARGLGKTPRLFAVDTWAGSGEPEWTELYAADVASRGISIYDQFIRNMERCGVRDLVTPIRSDSAAAADLFEDRSCLMVYIDADHRYDAVRKDVLAWYPKVRSGGWLAGHDYDCPFVHDAVHDALAELGANVSSLRCKRYKMNDALTFVYKVA